MSALERARLRSLAEGGVPLRADSALALLDQVDRMRDALLLAVDGIENLAKAMGTGSEVRKSLAVLATARETIRAA